MRELLLAIRDQILVEMEEEVWRSGWFYASPRPTNWPLPWDINNGWCEEFAVRAAQKIGGDDYETTYELWIDDLEDDAPAHCVLVHNGRYYDAECLDGVNDWHDLPICGVNPRPA